MRLFAFVFTSPTEETNRIFFFIFLLFVAARLFVVSPDWEVSFLVKLLFLCLYQKDTNKVFFALLVIIITYLFLIWPWDFDVLQSFILGSAGAGAIHFLFIAKPETQMLGVSCYILSNILLGFHLPKVTIAFLGLNLPKVTIAFLGLNLIFGFFLKLISILRGEPVLTVLSKTKLPVRAIYFAALYLQNTHFFPDDPLGISILSLFVQILFLHLFLLVFSKQESDEGPESEEAGVIGFMPWGIVIAILALLALAR